MYSLHKISVSVFLLLFLLPANASGQYRIATGADEAGMGFSCITRKGFWSSFHNQALLSANSSIFAGFNYENRFGISELGTRTAALILPAGNTSLGIIYSYTGYPDFRREMAGIACGLSLSEDIAAGIQIDYFSEKTSGEYDNNNSVSFEAGMLFRLSESVSAGIHIFNPVPDNLRESALPSSISAGAGIELNSALFAGAGVEMSTGKKLLLRTGFEYETTDNLWLRGGFCNENTSFSFGLGYLIKTIKLDLGFVTHEKLGISSSASITFKIR